MYFVRPANGVRIDLRQTDASQLASLHVLRDIANRVLDRGIGIYTGALEQVKRLFAVQHPQTFIYASSNVLLATVWHHSTFNKTAFDGKHNLLGIFGIFREVLIEEMERIALWCAV